MVVARGQEDSKIRRKKKEEEKKKQQQMGRVSQKRTEEEKHKTKIDEVFLANERIGNWSRSPVLSAHWSRRGPIHLDLESFYPNVTNVALH